MAESAIVQVAYFDTASPLFRPAPNAAPSKKAAPPGRMARPSLASETPETTGATNFERPLRAELLERNAGADNDPADDRHSQRGRIAGIAKPHPCRREREDRAGRKDQRRDHPATR
jgi:hypothetical protein